MHKGKTILGLIPARGESKELPRKNVQLLSGKPLIGWTIEQALASKYLDKVIVSTDDTEIAQISKKYGAEVPFLRPNKLAKNKAKMIDVIIHAINWLESNGARFDLMMLLQPTSPLRTTKDIDNSVRLLFKKNANAIVSVSQVDHHPYWSNILPSSGRMINFIKPEIMNINRQDLPEFFRLNGAIFLSYCNHLKKQKTFFGKKTYSYIMSKEKSVDIDSKFDFKLAEFILKNK